MRIQCSIKRKGGTSVAMRGKTYNFKPEGDGRHIADVDDDDVETFLAITECYSLADEEPEPEPEPSPEPEVTPPVEPAAFPPAGNPENSGEPEPTPEPDDDTGSADGTEVALEELGEADLAAKYAEVFGKPPHHSAKPASIIAKINEAITADKGE